jgi:hypothetical protein
MSRRVYIFALLASASVAVLLLLHHNVDKLPFGTPQIWKEQEPEPVLTTLRPVCQESDLFEAEYGRTNLRMTRAYEGEQQVKAVADTRFAAPTTTVHPQSPGWSRNHYLSHWRKQYVVSTAIRLPQSPKVIKSRRMKFGFTNSLNG